MQRIVILLTLVNMLSASESLKYFLAYPSPRDSVFQINLGVEFQHQNYKGVYQVEDQYKQLPEIEIFSKISGLGLEVTGESHVFRVSATSVAKVYELAGITENSQYLICAASPSGSGEQFVSSISHFEYRIYGGWERDTHGKLFAISDSLSNIDEFVLPYNISAIAILSQNAMDIKAPQGNRWGEIPEVVQAKHDSSLVFSGESWASLFKKRGMSSENHEYYKSLREDYSDEFRHTLQPLQSDKTTTYLSIVSFGIKDPLVVSQHFNSKGEILPLPAMKAGHHKIWMCHGVIRVKVGPSIQELVLLNITHTDYSGELSLFSFDLASNWKKYPIAGVK